MFLFSRSFGTALLIPMLGVAIALAGVSDRTANARPGSSDSIRTRIDPFGIEQVWVPPGTFLMGTDDSTLAELRRLNPPSWVLRELLSEAPQHMVRLLHGFWMDRYEVTNRAFQAFVNQGGYRQERYWSQAGLRWLNRQNIRRLPAECIGTAPNEPRCCVTWFEAEAYAHWRGGTLPTEAQWEYAARGPGSLRYPWGNRFDSLRCNVTGRSGLVPVGSYPDGASWVGAYDMAGNAMEWVQDWLDVNYYASRVRDDPPGPATGERKVEKGGWWGSNPFVARSAYRHFEDPPEYADKHIGFRIVSR